MPNSFAIDLLVQKKIFF